MTEPSRLRLVLERVSEEVHEPGFVAALPVELQQRVLMDRVGKRAGKIFRIGLMGAASTRENVLLLLEALDAALRAEGYTPPGSPAPNPVGDSLRIARGTGGHAVLSWSAPPVDAGHGGANRGALGSTGVEEMVVNLAIAKQLTELMGGSVTVESTPGQGSTFTITLNAEPA